MPTARHTKVKDLLFAASLVPPSERGLFLDQACAGDDVARREVESLLSFYEDAPGATPAPVRLRRATQPKPRYRKGRIVAGRYRIERMVGRGGMGEVYQAYDGLMRQSVALKVLHVTDDVHRRRLVEEVRLARQVTHAGVCRVHDVGEHEGSPFLTMELIHGVDLAARLARSGPLPSDEVTHIAVRLCEALAAAHEAGVLHRDLKPSNILVDRQGGIYITDFGIATGRTLDARGSEVGQFGTPTYMAPEETEATGSVTERTDLYSLGLVLYELLTGAPPFDDPDLSILLELQRSATPEPPSHRVSDIDTALEAVIMHLLVKDPIGRPESARAVLTALASERGPRLALETLPSQRERRPVLTLLCQLAAPLEVVTDPEWPELVRIFNARCTVSCRLRGGSVVRHFDRGLVVRFGHPSAREEDAESAVRAGLDIVTEARTRPLVPPDRGRLAAAVVIETGSAVVQSGRVIETDQLGEESARLEAQVEPDSVVVSTGVLALVRDGFSSDALERPSGEAAWYRITGARQRLGLEAGAARLTPFTGRELELARLERWWREADDGKGRIVLVTGDAGIGKSRIGHELWKRVRHQGIGLEARCSSFHQNTPLHPFVEMITHSFGLDRTDAGEARRTKLHQGLAALGARADELLPTFSAWLSIDGSSAQAPAARAPHVDRRALIAAIIEWILALAETNPILLLCEDVQWSDPTSREAIDRLVDQTRQARVLLVLTFRPLFSPPWKGSGVNHLELQPLSTDEARDLVAATPDHTTLEAASIVSRADGNPLFLEELIKDANQSRRAPGAAQVPLTLRGLLTARLDRLGAARRLAQAAAVCGRTFRYPLLASLAAEDGPNAIELEAGLARLLDAEIIFQRGTLPRASFRFKDALFQEAAYETLPARDRRRWHELLARRIPDLDPELAATQPEVLAMHWAAAGKPEEAFEWWNRAGLRALERSAYIEASRTLEQALRALPKAVGPAERRGREIELRLALTASESARQFTSDAVLRHIRRLDALCAGLEGGDQLVTALVQTARVRMGRGEMRAALRIVDRLRELTGGVRDPYLRAAAESQVANLLTLSGRLAEADRFYERCLESYGRAEPRSASPLTIDSLAMARFARALREWLRGRSGSARSCLDAAIEHADRLGHPFSQVFTRVYGAGIALLNGDADRWPDLLTQGARLASDVGAIGLLAVARMFDPELVSSTSAAAMGRAERRQEALRRHQREGPQFLRSLGIAELARALEVEGRPDDALAALDAAIHEATHGQDSFLVPEILRRRGELLARLGRFDEAEAMLRRSVNTARRAAATGLDLRGTLSLARLLSAQGRGKAARRALAAMLDRLPADVDVPERDEAFALRDALGPDSRTAAATS